MSSTTRLKNLILRRNEQGKYELSLKDLEHCVVKLPENVTDVNIHMVASATITNVGWIEESQSLRPINGLIAADNFIRNGKVKISPKREEKQYPIPDDIAHDQVCKNLKLLSIAMDQSKLEPMIKIIGDVAKLVEDEAKEGRFSVPENLPKFLWKILVHDLKGRAPEDLLHKPMKVRILSNEDMKFMVTFLPEQCNTMLYRARPNERNYPLLKKQEDETRLLNPLISRISMWSPELLKFREIILNRKIFGQKETLGKFEDSLEFAIKLVAHKMTTERNDMLYHFFRFKPRTIALKRPVEIDEETIPYRIMKMIKDVPLTNNTKRFLVKTLRVVTNPEQQKFVLRHVDKLVNTNLELNFQSYLHINEDTLYSRENYDVP